MAGLNGRLRDALPAVNLAGLVVAVAVMWWRIGALEVSNQGLTAAVAALKVEVAVLSQQFKDRP